MSSLGGLPVGMTRVLVGVVSKKPEIAAAGHVLLVAVAP